MSAPARRDAGGADRLAGRRIVLTRSEEDIAPWARKLARLGAEPVALPCIDAEPLDTPDIIGALGRAAARADWIVFTSRRGADTFVRLAGPDAARGARIAAVGPATAEAARARLGRDADLVGEGGTAASLADALLAAIHGGPSAAAGQRQRDDERDESAEARLESQRATASGAAGRAPVVLLALAENAGGVLERTLAEAGADCTRIDVYRTVPTVPHEPRTALSTLAADAVWLASPSAVTGFLNQVVPDARPAFVAIGPSTAAAARERGLDAVEAREPSFDGLLEATRWEATRWEAAE